MTKRCAHETGPWLAGQQWPRCLKCEIERLRDQLRVACIQRDNANDETERLKKQIEILQRANRFLSEQIPSAHELEKQA